MNFEQRDQRNRHLLYDPRVWSNAAFSVFDDGAREAHGLQPFGGGRNSTWLWSREQGPDWVLRHYARGGMVGKLIRGRYFWQGLERTRAWRELRLLGWMRDQGLPVPKPVAGHAIRLGMVYEQHLVTERIATAETLQGLLQKAPLPEVEWRSLGQCLRRFHDAGVHHADLNASNVMRDAQGQFHLLDFDRGRRQDDRAFVPEVLARFLRSLRKQQARHPVFHFSEADWVALLAGHGL